MRHAWLKVGAVAIACMVALAALPSPWPQRRTTEVTGRQEAPPRVMATVPAVLRSERVDETSGRIQEQPTAHLLALRQEETVRQTAKEAARAEETRLAALCEVEAQATAQREEEARQRAAAREARQAEENRVAALRAAEVRSAEDERRTSEALRIAQEMRAQAPTAAPIQTSFSGSAAASALPARRVDGWVRYRLRPGLIFHLPTHGRPCTVRTDTAMDIFPNNPSLSHRIVEAGGEFHFPLLRGQWPASIHARPLGGASGTLEFRYDD